MHVCAPSRSTEYCAIVFLNEGFQNNFFLKVKKTIVTLILININDFSPKRFHVYAAGFSPSELFSRTYGYNRAGALKLAY